MSEESTVFVTMYYDNYEYRFGDGFYPCLKKEVEYDAETTVGFVLRDLEWIQTSGFLIYGLDGNYGKELLEFLNNNYFFPKQDKNIQDTLKLCISSMKTNGMTDKVLSTNMNDLTKGEFVYRVVDEMISGCWHSQAEYIISLIGYDRALTPTSIRSKDSMLLYPKLIRKNGRVPW